MKHRWNTRDIVFIALFATLTIIGTSIRVPMPAAIGNPFVHLGNTVVLLAILLLGSEKGALAGGIGFFIFDLFNGFAVEAPYFLIECFVIGLVVHFSWKLVHFHDHPFYKLLIPIIFACLTKLIMTYLKNIVTSMIMGASFTVSCTAALTTLFPSIINVITTMILVSILYYPLKKILSRVITIAAH